jgi:LPXTG-site transpeptidase (sortase) family protein
MGGNAVLSGHLDYHNYGAAVFWRLKELHEGDIVEVRLADGSILRYRVSLKLSYDARMAPVLEILGPTSKEVVTLITCGGTFDSGSRNYSDRLVVRAERI